MADYVDKTFTKKRLVLDGHSYKRCRFEECDLIYEGGPYVHLEDNHFINCRWAFDGPAARTVAFMSELYGSGGQALIEATFENIRRKRHRDLDEDKHGRTE